MKKQNIKEVDVVKEQLGAEVTLYDEQDQEHVFHLLLELSVDGKHYAYFKSASLEEGDIEVLKVNTLENGEMDLVPIENDDEWEDIAELFDEWTYSSDE